MFILYKHLRKTEKRNLTSNTQLQFFDKIILAVKLNNLISSQMTEADNTIILTHCRDFSLSQKKNGDHCDVTRPKRHLGYCTTEFFRGHHFKLFKAYF